MDEPPGVSWSNSRGDQGVVLHSFVEISEKLHLPECVDLARCRANADPWGVLMGTGSPGNLAESGSYLFGIPEGCFGCTVESRS